MSGLLGRPVPGNRWDLLGEGHPDPAPSVSVVIVHYEQQAQLDRTLLALSRQDHPADRLELIVVDDGSAVPPTVPEGVRLLVQEDRGFRLSAARNLGAAAATGDILCFLDADTVPEPGYLRALVRLPALDSDCVAVGRRRHADLGDAAADQPVELAGPAHELTEPAWLIDAYRNSRNLLEVDDRSYRFVIGAVIGCARSLFEETGGFDESFTSYGGEDWEWAYRAWLAGAVLAHVPDAVAWHDGAEWAARDDSSIADKNAETVRLSQLIPVPGSAPFGLSSPHPDVTVRIDDAHWSLGQRFVCADAVQADLPRSELDGDPSRARIAITVHAPVRPDAGVLQRAVDEVIERVLGSLVLTAPDGSALVTIVQRRAERRMRRWGDDTLFPAVVRAEPGLRDIPSHQDVAAYLGGWG